MNGTTRALGHIRRRVLIACLAAASVAGGAFHQPAHAAAVTSLAGQASSSGFPVGTWIFDSVTLGYGLSPTGTITFRLYGPSDPTCAAAPIYTSTVTANGNGYYQSGSYQAHVAGTYRWMAAYSGDSVNTPAGPTPCRAASAAVIVAKRVPTLSASASIAVAPGMTWNTATLTGGGPAGPTGTLTFSLYGPADVTCAGPPAFTMTRAVAGNGSYTSASFTPAAPGIYQWVVRYGGDANNHAASTSCVDPANALSILRGVVASALTLTVTPAAAAPGSKVTVAWAGIAQPTSGDWIGLYALGAADGAAKTWRYTTGTATGNAVLTVPWGTPLGLYEVRLFANNSTARLATAPLLVA